MRHIRLWSHDGVNVVIDVYAHAWLGLNRQLNKEMLAWKARFILATVHLHLETSYYARERIYSARERIYSADARMLCRTWGGPYKCVDSWYSAKAMRTTLQKLAQPASFGPIVTESLKTVAKLPLRALLIRVTLELRLRSAETQNGFRFPVIRSIGNNN